MKSKAILIPRPALSRRVTTLLVTPVVFDTPSLLLGWSGMFQVPQISKLSQLISTGQVPQTVFFRSQAESLQSHCLIPALFTVASSLNLRPLRSTQTLFLTQIQLPSSLPDAIQFSRLWKLNPRVLTWTSSSEQLLQPQAYCSQCLDSNLLRIIF